jgi:cytochrome c556
MRKVMYGCLAVLAVSLVGFSMAEEKKDKPKAIKVIMKTAHTAPEGEDPLCKKFAGGKTSEDETKTILALYEDLGKNKPPQGDEDEWKAKTKALLSAAKDVAAKKEGGTDAFKKAINCKDCHETFRPKS